MENGIRDTAPPRVSILIPTFNRARYLEESVRSALLQTYRDLEVIVVDDGSTDNTAEIIGRFADSRLRYLCQAHCGVSAALNTAWRAARGVYLARLDSDDVFLPHHLATLVPLLESNPTAGLAYARAQAMDEVGKPLPQILGAPMKFPESTLKSELYADCVFPIACVFRRECIEKVGGFNEALFANVDWDFAIRVAEHYPFVYQPVVVARYRMHPESLTGKGSARYELLGELRVKMLESYFMRPDLPPEAIEVKTLALRNVYMFAGIRLLAIGQLKKAFVYFKRAVAAHHTPLSSVLRIVGVATFYLYLSKTGWGVRLVDGLVNLRRRWARTS